jgi:hypothetical protein
MEIPEFLGLNVVIIGIVVLVVLVYLVFLINKRRKKKFLHQKDEPEASN